MPIRVLPRELTEKIAAGEVVERPASVVKELVENALDAGARTVQVVVGEDPADYIEVVDDGVGMAPEEIPLALRRHATSKIASYEDLGRIASLGFRGEALPSLAAVAELQIESRQADAPFGVRVWVRRGERSMPEEVGMPRGTRVIVRNLFHATPARRKFLRSRQTELGQVADTFIRLALSRLDVSFHLRRGRRPWIQAPAAADLRQRTAQILGRELAEGLRPVEGRREGYAVEGLAGPSRLHKVSSRGLFLFVNRRPVHDVGLQRVIRAAYRGLLPKERYPVAVLFFTVPSEEVDVNVHPTKMEVHFSRPGRVRELLEASLAAALRPEPWRGGGEMEEGEEYGPEDRGGGRSWWGETREKSTPLSVAGPASRIAEAPRAFGEAGARGHGVAEAGGPEARGVEEPLFTRFRIIGQFRESYLVCEYGDRLVLIDQHAAHERIAYERLRDAEEREGIPLQPLLIPEVVELPPHEAGVLKRHLGRLGEWGLEVDPYGEGSFAVKAVPALLGQVDPGALVRDIAEELVEVERTRQVEELTDRVLARMACHSVVRAGRPLRDAEMEALLRMLDSKPGLLSCPHGRPIMISWPLREIEKRFQRT